MQTEKKFAKLALLAIAAALLLSLSTLASAESDAARAIRASAATVPTNIAGISAYPDPPKGFNPVTASDEDLAAYGFPARPDKQANPDEYLRWARAMQRAKIRWHGELKPAPASGHAMTRATSSPLAQAIQPEASGPKNIQTNNASGVIIASGQKTFNKNSIQTVIADITVPTVEFPQYSTACTGEGYISISAVGIDGFVFDTGHGYGYDPQFEGGVYEQIACSGDIYYFAVTGWQGNNYYVAFNFNPGDIAYIVAYTEGGSNSAVYLQDNTTGTYGTFSVTTSGLVGATADFTVERMCCSGNEPIALGNTTNIAFGRAFATNLTDTKTFYPGSQATTTQVLTMTDDAGDQSIEEITQGSGGYEGRSGLWFETNNCAAFEGCTP